MQTSAILAFAAALGAVTSFELGTTSEDLVGLTEACQVLDSFDPSSLEERSIEKRCNFDDCDDCSNNVSSPRTCSGSY